MKKNKSIIAIIPARGGSKGIPRKNLRSLNGYPLISYVIKTCIRSNIFSDIIVSTEDMEVKAIAEIFGAHVLIRKPELADDNTTLDPVIRNALLTAEAKFQKQYDLIFTIQPTSPLLSIEDIKSVKNLLQKNNLDTVLTVKKDNHLSWSKNGQKYTPNYKKRVNRQYLKDNFIETGGIIACTRDQCLSGSRVGKRIDLQIIPKERAIDIDDFDDFRNCEAKLRSKKIVFSAIGSQKVGLGHSYRVALLASELTNHDLVFVIPKEEDMAIEFFKEKNYKVVVAKKNTLAKTIIDESPDLVINDILDTSEKYMDEIKNFGCKIVNFEDSSAAASKANLVINALYESKNKNKSFLTGHKYFCLRDEFIFLQKNKKVNNEVNNVMLSFGGVDEGNLTLKSLEAIGKFCNENNISINVILGLGYSHLDSIKKFKKYKNIKIIKNTKQISNYMNEADIAITSGGRTVFELASLRKPMIVICQNERETKHTFANEKNGIINLGHRVNAGQKKIQEQFINLVKDNALREKMVLKMSKIELNKGKKVVIRKILNLLEE